MINNFNNQSNSNNYNQIRVLSLREYAFRTVSVSSIEAWSNSTMKKFRIILVVTIFNILLVCNWMGVLLSDDIIAVSPNSTGLSTMNSFLPTRLMFTSNGGVLETHMAKKNEQYKTSVRFLDSDSGTPILNAVINIQGDTSKTEISLLERPNSGIYDINITPKTEERLSFQIKASKEGYVTSSVRLVLSVGLIPSDLLYFPSNQSIRIGVVEINSTYTIDVIYRSSGNPVTNADIDVRSYLDLNLTHIELGSGIYRINITLSEIESDIYIGIPAHSIAGDVEGARCKTSGYSQNCSGMRTKVHPRFSSAWKNG